MCTSMGRARLIVHDHNSQSICTHPSLSTHLSLFRWVYFRENTVQLMHFCGGPRKSLDMHPPYSLNNRGDIGIVVYYCIN